MAIDNYADLVDQVAEMSAHDPSAIMKTLLTLVESHLNRRLRVQDMIVREQLKNGTVADQFMYDWPDGALSITNIEVESNHRRFPLDLMSQEAMDRKFGTRTGVPLAYAIVGHMFELRPCPDGVYTLAISYHQRIPPLTPTNDTNWLLAAHPDIYLYGCLTFQAQHIRDMEAVAMWAEQFGGAAQEAGITDDANEWSGSTPEMVAL